MSSLKSSAALQYNVLLLERCLLEGEHIKFWTFTFPVVLHPVDAARLWQDLSRELRRSVGFCGVRVFELHPGGHGLHVHVATSEWFDVNAVRQISKRFGFGRLQVEEWKDGGRLTPGEYMAKYVSKQMQLWQGVKLRGVRWWSTFGRLPDKVRCCDVSVESSRRRLWDAVPDWVVCHVMGVADYSRVVRGRLSAFEKRALSAAKESFLNYFSNNGFGYQKKPFPVRLCNASRSFNFAKMWLCNQIYFDRLRITEQLNGVFERWGLRFRTLGWDSESVREWAFNPSF